MEEGLEDVPEVFWRCSGGVSVVVWSEKFLPSIFSKIAIEVIELEIFGIFS